MRHVYIHGAVASGRSFNYIRKCVERSDDIVLEYNSVQGFRANLKEMIVKLQEVDEDLLLVAHSLGGIYALHLASIFPDKVRGGVTMSTPYGGSQQADLLKLFPPFCGSQLLKDISPDGIPLQLATKIKLEVPWVNLVTMRGGTYWIPEANDGIVTLKSMKHRTDMQFVEVLADHFEITQSPESVDAINKMIVGIV